MSIILILGAVVIIIGAISRSICTIPKRDQLDFYYFRDHYPKGENKTVALFGATEKVGYYVLKHFLAHGYNVTVYIDDASKISIKHRRIKIREGKLHEIKKN